MKRHKLLCYVLLSKDEGGIGWIVDEKQLLHRSLTAHYVHICRRYSSRLLEHPLQAHQPLRVHAPVDGTRIRRVPCLPSQLNVHKVPSRPASTTLIVGFPHIPLLNVLPLPLHLQSVKVLTLLVSLVYVRLCLSGPKSRWRSSRTGCSTVSTPICPADRCFLCAGTYISVANAPVNTTPRKMKLRLKTVLEV